MKFIILIFSIFGIVFLGDVKERERKPLYFAPPNVLQHFSLGYRDFLADLLWLRFIQDADFCSFKKGRPVYKGDVKTCELGWSYNMVDAITELAPRFKTPYTLSSVILSVFTGDKKGAERILLKGLKHFPNDWRINFYAAYLYTVDIKNPELAARYAYQSAKNGGPYWLYSLSAKKYGEANQLLLGETILKNLLGRDLTDKQRAHVEEHWREFREEYMQKKASKP
ncbi:MAG: hypothetical protein OXM55_07165 [Bdellovibrionales bacterium]|nr:hypothetical protein [Bdellovibrionales bacterium]